MHRLRSEPCYFNGPYDSRDERRTALESVLEVLGGSWVVIIYGVISRGNYTYNPN